MSGTKTIQERSERRISAPEFETLIKCSPNLITRIGRDGRYRYVNETFARAAGVSASAAIGRPITEVGIQADYAPLLEQTMRKVIATGKEEIIEICFGDRFYQAHYVPQFGITGEIETVISYADDVTDRKEAREKLAREYAKTRALVLGIVAMISKVVEIRDQYTAGHQRHVSQLACAIAEEMGLPGRQAEGIRLAGLIHDIGKLSVPVEILNKMGRLTPVEVSIIRVHPTAGYEILKDVDFPWPIAEVARQHQERLDGTGYPQGLAGESILLEARIVSVADVVEAMTFARPYREPIGRDRALDQVRRGSGILYYSPAVDACLKLFREGRFHFDR